VPCWDEDEDSRKLVSARMSCMADTIDIGSLQTTGGWADSSRALWPEGLDATMLSFTVASFGVLPTDVFEVRVFHEEFELQVGVMVNGVTVSMLPLKYASEEDGAGECITLAGASGPLLEVSEATSGGEESCLAES